MEEEKINVNPDTLNGASDEVIIDDSLDAEAKVQALEEQNKKLFARAKKAEGFIQDSNGNWVKKEKPQVITNKVESKPYNILEDEVADLILDGYSKEETKFILANGGRKALEDKDSFLSVAINTKREQRKTERAVSQTSNSGFISTGGKTYSEEQLKNMSVEEMMKVLPHS